MCISLVPLQKGCLCNWPHAIHPSQVLAGGGRRGEEGGGRMKEAGGRRKEAGDRRQEGG